ncbi:helix-turn-helix transcriptional regulator [Pendulispora albinea]|uniref:Helix-turn-helix transcriptional regulator n=2 Tax=Pendulispora albinea TaxID=2741071 RepID=A0ABZ2MCJ3_9BACT
MSKAELARAAGVRPEIIRRLFTAEEPNPTLETVVRVIAAVGCTLRVVRAPRARAPKGRTVRQVATERGTRARNSVPSRRTSA